MKRALTIIIALAVAPRIAGATGEICGNDIDDDGNGVVDEGCAPTLTTGVCESPLSCGQTGMVSWSTGALHYDLPADISPKVPRGPGIGLRRFYTSAYSPGTGPTSVNHTPLGARWQHTYMSWVDHFGSGAGSSVIVHTSEGRDVLATYSGTASGWESFTPQAGFHVMSIQRNTASPNQYQVQLLTGEMLYFNSSGQLTQIWDNLLPTPNKVMLTWTSTSGGNVSTVTDASGKRRLLFNYTSNLLTSVNYQLLISSVWTTQQTTTYSFTSGTMMSASIGASLSQQYGYTSGYLTSITDATGISIASFAYSSTVGGQTDKVTTPNGTIGLELASTRTTCSGKTMLYFNRTSTGTCNTDADCSGGANFCGGKTGTGSTGSCFAAARCLGVSTVNGESVVTTVTTPAHSDSSACTGACADVAQYVWSATAGLLNATGTQDPLGNYTSVTYNANGLPTQIGYADNDSDPTNGGYARTTYLFYDAMYPGRLAETRRKSDLDPSSSSCSGAVTTGCAREVYTYGTDAQLLTMTQYGTTLNSSAATVGYTYTTNYVHDTLGRLSEIDGPVTSMRTRYFFFSSTDPKLDAFLQSSIVDSNGTNSLTTTILGYDFWGNATGRRDPDNTVSCRTFDASRNYVTQTREAMAGQTDCTTPNTVDIVKSWVRDSALRQTQYTRPDGSCVFSVYTTAGLLDTVKRRDDCNPASAGDTQKYLYTVDGQVGELDTYDSTSALKAKEPYSYYQSRRLQNVVNPVDSTYKQQVYDARGVLTEVDDEASLGKTVYAIDADHRLTAETRYKTGTTSDAWTFLHDWSNEQSSYTDGDSKTIQTVRDDVGRVVKLVGPDQTYPTLQLYDAAGRMTTKVEAFGGGALTHSFTYDFLSRPLNSDYAGTCPTGTPHPEIQKVYDAMPIGITCPIAGGAGCTNIAGRLAYVKVSLICSSAYAATDGSLDQETFYAYDSNGRVVFEYVRDDSGRSASHGYSWDKDGHLVQFVTPLGAKPTWIYGSAASNSDSDLVTELDQTGTVVASLIAWFPFGPLASYKQENMISGVKINTVVSRNVAYRITDIHTAATTENEGVAIGEDSKGRVTKRDYFDNSAGVQDSYFIYDNEDRVLCETTNLLATCPTTATSNVKNTRPATPYFTNAGDWTSIIRIDRGALHTDAFSLATGTHQISQIQQDAVGSALGHVTYTYNTLGDRASDSGSGTDETHTGRTYTYDQRHNLVNVHGSYIYSRVFSGGVWNITWHTYDMGSTFDARGRRVSKTFADAAANLTQQWFFYYDVSDRLTEIKFTPNIQSPSTFSIYQIGWLGTRVVAYTQSDFPSTTVSKRYAVTDETNRVIAMWSWPSVGVAAARVWSINPSAWANDLPPLSGASILQPFVFLNQFLDWETYAASDVAGSSTVYHEPALCLNGHRTYDPFTSGYLQLDALVHKTRSSYVYANSNPIGKSDPSGLDTMEGQCWYDDGYGWGDCLPLEDGGEYYDAGGGGGGAYGGGGGGYTCNDITSCGCSCRMPNQHTPAQCDTCVRDECYDIGSGNCVWNNHLGVLVCDENKINECQKCYCWEFCAPCVSPQCYPKPPECSPKRTLGAVDHVTVQQQALQ